MIGIYRVYLQLSATQTTDRSAQMYIAQNDFLSNIVTIPVYSTAQLSSMACTPATIDSGGTTTCTVVLTVAVPTSPTTITLSSSSSLFTVPATVVIPAASTSVSFTGTAGTVGAEQDVTITATLGSASTTATVTLDQ